MLVLILIIGDTPPKPTRHVTATRESRSRQRAVSRPTASTTAAQRGVEDFVADGLAWLAAHQRSDGVWDRQRFDEHCPPDDRCAGTAMRNEGPQFHTSVTSLATLAFLGAGHDHREGPYAKRITKAFEYLLAQQDESGSFAPGNPFEVYEHALATLAAAEAYATTRDPVFERPLRRAVVFLAQSQQSGGGWDYRARQTQRNDAAITGWVLMALRSASAGGVDAPAETVWRAIDFFERATTPDGNVRYADEPIHPQLDRATGQRVLLYGPATTAIGLFARSVIGLRLDDDIATRQSTALLRDMPSYEVMSQRDPNGTQSEYYWLFATYALRQRGGDDWPRWNRQLRNAILEYQERPVRGDGSRRHVFGSWPAYGLNWGSQWGRTGGRVYATAVNILSLETSYRRRPAYLASPALIGPDVLQRYVQELPAVQRRDAVERVLKFDRDTAEPVLLGLTRAEDERLRTDSALGLARLKSPLAREPLMTARERAEGDERTRIEDALRALPAQSPGTRYGMVLQTNATARMSLFDTAGQPIYYGQIVCFERDGRIVAKGRVDRRFVAHRAAAVTLLEGDTQTGDQAVLAATDAGKQSYVNHDHPPR